LGSHAGRIKISNGRSLLELSHDERARQVMKIRLAAMVIALALSSRTALTQAPAEPSHAPDGGSREMISSIAIPPMPNAPFSATVETEWTRYLENGGRMVLKNRRLIARDSLGRVFQERRTFVSDGSPVQSQVWRTELAEPQTHTAAYCDTRSRVCELRVYTGPPSQPVAAGPFAKATDSLVREDLGVQTVNGLDLIGTRETQPLGLTATGSDRPLAVVKEFWYSKALGMNVMTRRNDPRSSAEVFTVTDIHRSEPDRSLFALPADARIVDLRSQAVSRTGP
jgi:hypothetical protein